jgi:beta-lactamase class A
MRTLGIVALALMAAVRGGEATLSETLAAIAEDAGGRLGVAAVEIGGSRRVHLNGAEAFPMQSVFKLPLGVHVLRLVDEGVLRLDKPVAITPGDMPPRGYSPIRDRWPQGVTLTVEELLQAMLVESDNTAADVLLQMTGGPAALTARLRGLGIDGIRADRSERQLGEDLLGGAPRALERYLADPRDTATPEAAAALLVKISEGAGLKPDSHARLLRWMTEGTRGAGRIKGRLPAGTAVAHRTGTGPTLGGVNACTNDIGLVTLPDGRRFAIAVFLKGSRAPEARREDAIARAARAVYDAWGRVS